MQLVTSFQCRNAFNKRREFHRRLLNSTIGVTINKKLSGRHLLYVLSINFRPNVLSPNEFQPAFGFFVQGSILSPEVVIKIHAARRCRRRSFIRLPADAPVVAGRTTNLCHSSRR